MVHYGHANACRQAKQMGNYLIVGIHSDGLSFFEINSTNKTTIYDLYRGHY